MSDSRRRTMLGFAADAAMSALTGEGVKSLLLVADYGEELLTGFVVYGKAGTEEHVEDLNHVITDMVREAPGAVQAWADALVSGEASVTVDEIPDKADAT